jgi:hypothetical protein
MVGMALPMTLQLTYHDYNIPSGYSTIGVRWDEGQTRPQFLSMLTNY